MSSEEVTTTGNSDGGKKSSKPIMEKRRRARINASLVELKSLLMDVIKSEGAIHSKMEKADILEMTVRHLRALQNQHAPTDTTGFRGFESVVKQTGKFSLGYTECISEVGKFLNSLDIEEIDLKTKIIDHLANSVTRTRTNDVDINTTMTSLESSMMHTTKPLSGFSSIQIAPKSLVLNENKSATSTGSDGKVGLEENARTRGQQLPNVQYMTKGDQIKNTSTFSGIVSKPISVPVTGSSNEEALLQSVSISPVISKHSTALQQQQVVDLKTLCVSESSLSYPKFSVSPIPTQLFSGLQIVPTTLTGNEVAFVVPANLLTSTGNVFATMAAQSYVLPVYKMDVCSNKTSSVQSEAPLSQVSEITSSDTVTSTPTSPTKQRATHSPTNETTCASSSVTQCKLLYMHAQTNVSCVRDAHVSCNETSTSATQRHLINTHGNQPYDLSKRPLLNRSSNTCNTGTALSEFRPNHNAGKLRICSKEITPNNSGQNYVKSVMTRVPTESRTCFKQDASTPRLQHDGTSQTLTARNISPSCSATDYSQSANGREQRGPSASDDTSSDDVWRPW